MVVRVHALAGERLAITSLAFMFESCPTRLKDVERELVVVLAGGDRAPPAAVPSADVSIQQAEVAIARAPADLIRPSQRTTPTGIGRPETGKLSIALRVSAPHSSRSVSVLTGRQSTGARRRP